jgi:hypothetical protein
MDDNLTIEQRAVNHETWRHIHRVMQFMNRFAVAMLDRALRHDQSKLAPPEVALFAAAPPLGPIAYGTPAYEESRRRIMPALEHHYAHNRHHPEHWPTPSGAEIDDLREDIAVLESIASERIRGAAVLERAIGRLKADLAVLESPINNMNLLDVTEMFCDWAASSERHHDGNIRKSIEHNTGRFGIGQQLRRIFENTIDPLRGE